MLLGGNGETGEADTADGAAEAPVHAGVDVLEALGDRGVGQAGGFVDPGAAAVTRIPKLPAAEGTTEAGEDMVASCPKCDYAANLEKATSKLEPVEDLKATGNGIPELVHTPGKKTIEEVAQFLGVSPKQKMKTLALVGTWITEEGKRLEWPIAVFLRGDHMLNEAKLLGIK